MCELPLDLVIKIFSRLPRRSFMRLKCLSKKWLSLISSRYFCYTVFTSTRLYMSLMDKGMQRLLLSISSNTSVDNTSFVVVDQDFSIPDMGSNPLNVSRGVMCFTRKKGYGVYIPSTKQLLILPSIKSDIISKEDQIKKKHKTTKMCFIGYDPVSDQYKVLCTIVAYSKRFKILKSEHWVFVLEAGGSWRKVNVPENYLPHGSCPEGRSTNSGSVIHYMAWLNYYECVVVSFDIRSEKLISIPIPMEEVESERYLDVPGAEMKADIIDYGGKIAIFDITFIDSRGLVVLRVLEETQEWSTNLMVLQPCQKHLVNDVDLIVKGTTQDGKVILGDNSLNLPQLYHFAHF